MSQWCSRLAPDFIAISGSGPEHVAHAFHALTPTSRDESGSLARTHPRLPEFMFAHVPRRRLTPRRGGRVPCRNPVSGPAGTGRFAAANIGRHGCSRSPTCRPATSRARISASARARSGSRPSPASSSSRMRAWMRAAPQRLRVRDFGVEHHHRVARDEALREMPLELEGDGLAAHEVGVAHGVAHFGVVLDRHGARWPRCWDVATPRSARTLAATAARCRRAPPSTTQSSNAAFIPWPWKGTIACAASPIRSTRPSTRQGRLCTGAELSLRMLRELGEQLRQRATASGNCARTAPAPPQASPARQS